MELLLSISGFFNVSVMFKHFFPILGSARFLVLLVDFLAAKKDFDFFNWPEHLLYFSEIKLIDF